MRARICRGSRASDPRDAAGERLGLGLPFAGLLYPALTKRSVDFDHANLYAKDGDRGLMEDLKRVLGV